MKRVLVISYYWPPAAGAGVHRWLKFCKYLRQYGWEPIVYTPENPENPATDYSMSGAVPDNMQVIRRKIKEPYTYYKLLTGRKPSEKVQTGFLSESRTPGITERVSTWLRGNLFIPDARMWWIRPSVDFLLTWLQNNRVDAMVSTGPPHSMHLIALGLKKRTGIPWLADFRDPWTRIDYYHHLMLTPWADRKHKRLEQDVLRHADRVVTVSNSWARDLKELGRKQVTVITNGFDPDDYLGLHDFNHDMFSITHLGSMNADRNPVSLWDALGELVTTDDFFKRNLRIRLIGKTDFSVFECINKHGLEDYTQKVPYLPHADAIKLASKSAVLMLPLNNTPNVMGIAPGKLYEYLALNRPILAIGPVHGDTARILQACKAGEIIDFGDKEGIKNLLWLWKDLFLNKQLILQQKSIEAYSRKTLTGDLAVVLDSMTTTHNKQ